MEGLTQKHPHLFVAEVQRQNTHHFCKKLSKEIQRGVCLFACSCVRMYRYPFTSAQTYTNSIPTNFAGRPAILDKFRAPTPGTTLKRWLRISKLVCTVSGQSRAKAGQGNVIECSSSSTVCTLARKPNLNGHEARHSVMKKRMRMGMGHGIL